MIQENSGGSLQRTILEKWLRNKKTAYLTRMIRKFWPRDVVEQQEKIDQVLSSQSTHSTPLESR